MQKYWMKSSRLDLQRCPLERELDHIDGLTPHYAGGGHDFDILLKIHSVQEGFSDQENLA